MTTAGVRRRRHILFGIVFAIAAVSIVIAVQFLSARDPLTHLPRR
jgi:hypothetical protein